MGYALCATLCRTTEWAMQLPVYSGLLPWSDKLKAVFNNDKCYKLDSLPRSSGKDSFKTIKSLFAVLTQLTPQVSWLNRGTGFAQQTISSVCPSLGLSAVGPHSHQVFSPVLLVRRGWKTLFTVSEAVYQPPFLGRKGKGHPGYS